MQSIRLGFLVLIYLVAGCSEKAPEGAEPKMLSGDLPEERTEVIKPAITGANAPDPEEPPALGEDGSLAPLPIEKTGNVERLPRSYPESWVLVDEINFFSMFGGKVIVLDVAETRPAKRIKGLLDKSLMGLFAQSEKRGELYVLESFHERGSRGARTDVFVIYDKETLSIKKEIVWPRPNRLQALPNRFAMSVSLDERFLYGTNLDPATSFTVVDLETQQIVTEIGTPGCVMTYPVGNRSVASLCSNGGMLTTVLKDDGTLKSQKRIAPFFDTNDTPIFEHPVVVDGTAYFPSFEGLLHQIDVSGEEAKYLGSWDMLSDEAKADNWRPSGLILNDVDDAGLMYTIFQPDGHEGTQTHGGTQVWVFDLQKRERVQVIETPGWAISIGVTRGAEPLLVVTNGELNLDVINAGDGSLIQSISDFGNVTPLNIFKSY